MLVTLVIGIILLVVFIIPCITTFLFFGKLKKQIEKEAKRIEKINADEEEKFERRIKEQREYMEDFKKKNFPNY